MTPKSKTFGEEIERIRLFSSPGELTPTPSKKYLFVSDPTKPFIHRIDTKSFAVKRFFVETPSSKLAISPDEKWLYFINPNTGGIRILDLKKEQLIPQGDLRYPNQKELLPENPAPFISLLFFKGVPISIEQRKKGEILLRNRTLAVATTADGYAYIIDSNPYTDSRGIKLPPHRIFLNREPSPFVQNLQIIYRNQSLGDPISPFRKEYPRLKATQNLPNGIEVHPYRARTESWILKYEGKIVSNLLGRFLSSKPNTFTSVEKVDFKKLGVRRGDYLILHNCRDSGGQTPDGGTTPPESTQPLPEEETVDQTACQLTIEGFSGPQLEVKPPTNLPDRPAWEFSIRAAKSYTIVGSKSGLLTERAIENQTTKTYQFSITILSGTKPTPRELTFRFDILSGISPKKARLGGYPLAVAISPNHPQCGGNLCKLDNCSQHPNCTGKKCRESPTIEDDGCSAEEYCLQGTCKPLPKLWIVDPLGNRIFILSLYRTPLLEITLR